MLLQLQRYDLYCLGNQQVMQMCCRGFLCQMGNQPHRRVQLDDRITQAWTLSNRSYVVDLDDQPLSQNRRFITPTKVFPSPSRETELEVKAPEMEVPKSQQSPPVQSEWLKPLQKELPLPMDRGSGMIQQSELNSSLLDVKTTEKSSGVPDKLHLAVQGIF